MIVLILFVFLFLSKTTIQWVDCPVYTSLSTPYKNIFFFKKEAIYLDDHKTFSNIEEIPTECAEVLLPLDYEKPKGNQVYVFVKRYLREGAKKNLWVFPKYTGSSSDKLEYLYLNLYKILHDVNIYYVDHRGVGRSGRIGCVACGAETEGSVDGIEIDPIEIDACRGDFITKYEEDDLHFSVTFASKDVLEIISMINADEGDVFDTRFYGIGYGSYWVSRMMQLIGNSTTPELWNVKQVILDSVYSQKGEDRFKIDDWSNNFNEIGMQILNMCYNDTDCKARLNTFPKLTIDMYGPKEFINEKSLCNEAKDIFRNDPNVLKNLLGTMLVQRNYRNLIPSLFYRIIRCSEDHDHGVFEYLSKKIDEEDHKKLSRQPFDSIILGLHVISNELYSYPIPKDPVNELERSLNASFFSILHSSLGNYLKSWPKYNIKDPYWRNSFSTSLTDILILNGELDPITPPRYAISQYNSIKVTGDAQKHMLIVPNATHVVIENSPMKDGNEDCAFSIIYEFLTNNRVDQSCFTDMEGIDFYGQEEQYSLFLYGCKEPYDCDYIERTKNITISLQLFIAIEGLTIIFFVILISVILYVIIPKKSGKKKEEKNEEYLEIVEDDLEELNIDEDAEDEAKSNIIKEK